MADEAVTRRRPTITPEEAASMSPGAAASFAALATQVATLDSDFTELKTTIVGVDRKFSEALTNFGTRFETALASVTAKLDERGRTQWPTLISAGVLMLAIMAAIGTLAYRPIESDIARHERWLNLIDDRYIADLRRDNDRLRAELLLRAPK